MSGKGSAPRNLGPKFRENYDSIFRKYDPDADITSEIHRIIAEEPDNEERHQKLIGLSFAKAGRELKRRNERFNNVRTVPPHP